MFLIRNKGKNKIASLSIKDKIINKPELNNPDMGKDLNTEENSQHFQGKRIILYVNFTGNKITTNYFDKCL